jgi:hypothetical protein
MKDLRFSQRWLWRIVSSGMLRCVAALRTEVSGELIASLIRVTRIGEQGTKLAVTSNRRTLVFLPSFRRLLGTASVVPSSLILVTLMKEALRSSETSVLTRATWRNIPEDTILQDYVNFLRVWSLRKSILPNECFTSYLILNEISWVRALETS